MAVTIISAFQLNRASAEIPELNGLKSNQPLLQFTIKIPNFPLNREFSMAFSENTGSHVFLMGQPSQNSLLVADEYRLL